MYDRYFRETWSCPRAGPKPNLQQVEVYSDFFTRTLDFAIFSSLDGYPQAKEAGIGRKGEGWEWIQRQVREGVRNPEWWRRNLVDKTGVIYPELFRRIAKGAGFTRVAAQCF